MTSRLYYDRKGTGLSEVIIEWGIVRNVNTHKGGFMPVLWIDGRMTGDTYGRGMDAEDALKAAQAEAESEAARYLGDWEIIVRPATNRPIPKKVTD